MSPALIALARQVLAASGALPPPRPVRRVANPAELAALKMHTEAIRDLAPRGCEAAWDIGAHYNAIRQNRLIRRAGEGDPRSYLAKHVPGLSGATIEIFAAVQRAFDKDDIVTYGPIKLYRLLSYFASAGGPGRTPLKDFELTVYDWEGRPVTRKFPECSEREIADSVQRHSVERFLAQNADKEGAVYGAVIEELRSRCGEWISSRVRVRLRSSGGSVLHLPPIPYAILAEAARAILAGVEGAEANRAKARQRAASPRRT